MIEETRDWSSVQDQYGSVIARICSIGVRPSPEKSSYRNVWSAAVLQAKNEEWQLVCANVFGLEWSQ
jgi:hypothetical protein